MIGRRPRVIGNRYVPQSRSATGRQYGQSERPSATGVIRGARGGEETWRTFLRQQDAGITSHGKRVPSGAGSKGRDKPEKPNQEQKKKKTEKDGTASYADPANALAQNRQPPTSVLFKALRKNQLPQTD